MLSTLAIKSNTICSWRNCINQQMMQGGDYPHCSITVSATYFRIKYGKYHQLWSVSLSYNTTVPGVCDEALEDETERVCDKACSHYNTMRILTPKRPLEDRSDRSAMLHCAAPTDTFDPHWATDLTDMARRWPGREMVGHGRRDGEKILTVTNSGLHSRFVCQQPTQKKFQL